MFYTILSVTLLVAVDRISKILAANLAGKGTIELIPSILGLQLLEGGNTGAAFGMLSNHTWVLIVITAIVIIVCLWILLFKRFSNRLGMIGLLLVTAGGLANLYDRVVYGAVTDFIRFLFFDFPTFNVADCYVTIGAVLLVISTLMLHGNESFFVSSKSEKKPCNSNDDGTEQQSFETTNEEAVENKEASVEESQPEAVTHRDVGSQEGMNNDA